MRVRENHVVRRRELPRHRVRQCVVSPSTESWPRKLLIWLKLSAALSAFMVLAFSSWLYAVANDIVVEPITVPERYEKLGWRSEKAGSVVSDKMNRVEASTSTRIRKDGIVSSADLPLLFVEYQFFGSKVSLNAVGDAVLLLLGRERMRVSGAITCIRDPSCAEGQAVLKMRVVKGKRGKDLAAIRVSPNDDLESLLERGAQQILHEVNPFIFAAHQFESGDFNGAIQVLGEIARDKYRDPWYVSAAYNLWGYVIEKASGHDVDALEKYMNAIELDPRSAMPHVNACELLGRNKKYQDAVAECANAIALDPQSASAYTNWGNLLSDQGDYDAAIAKYRKAILVDPKSASAYNNWGNLLSDQGNYDAAIAKYRKAIILDPDYEEAVYNLGHELFLHGPPDAARINFQRAIALNPTDAAAHNNLGVVLENMGKPVEAAQEYRTAIGLHLNYGDAKSNLERVQALVR